MRLLARTLVWLHVEQAIYMVNTFQFTRSARLILALQSFQSCSHGAGRKLSRAKARETLNLEEEIARLDAQGIVHGIRNQKDLDEAAGAYKSIDEVMANQTDLVDIVTELTPMAVIKG